MKNRREALRLVAAAMAAAGALEAAGSDSKVVNLAEAKANATGFGEQRAVIRVPGVSVGLTTLRPGQEPHPPHQHKEPEVIVLKEGAGQITLEGEVFQVTAGAVTYYEPGKMHGIRNTGDKDLSYYVIKWNLG